MKIFLSQTEALFLKGYLVKLERGERVKEEGLIPRDQTIRDIPTLFQKQATLPSEFHFTKPVY